MKKIYRYAPMSLGSEVPKGILHFTRQQNVAVLDSAGSSWLESDDRSA